MALSDSLERLRAALADRYFVERQLGQGGMALVYLARDLKHDRTVAIKILRGELAVALGSDRFLREIRLATQLQHPNILPVFDSGEAGGLVYFVMPFISGETLRDRLEREQQLPLPDAVRIISEVADALHYAHGRGIVHRDIKPENILLDQGHAIVADFGIAKAASEAGNEKLTETGMSVGTPAYMSPEQAAGGSHVDGRSDLYSLACMLYELLAGHPPFQGATTMAVLSKHAMDTPPSVRVVRPSIPEELEDVLMTALEKVPADRFPDVQQFSEALKEIDISPTARRAASQSMPSVRGLPSGGRRATGRTGSARGRSAKAPRRWRWPLLAGGAALLAAGGWAAWQFGFHRSSAAAPAGFDPRRIAVLYFNTRQGSDTLSFLADGLTEALIGELSQVKPLQVISSNGVRPYRGTATSPDSIARVLKVGTLVSGTVVPAGDSLKVTVTLINTANGSIVGNIPVVRPRSDVLALQDDIAQQVSLSLRKELGQELQLEQSRAGTRSAAAWETLQQGEGELRAADPLLAAGDSAGVERQYQRADSLFAHAARLDDRWTRPLDERGWLAYHRLRAFGSLDRAVNTDGITRGLGFAGAALKVAPDDPDALELRGTLRYYRWLLGLEPDPAAAARLFADAEADLRASTTADPNQASAWNSLSHLLMNKPELAEANLAARRAYELDPYLSDAYKTIWRLFTTSLDLDQSVQAQHWCAEGQQRFPDDSHFVECQILLFALKDTRPDVPKLWQLLSRYVTLFPPDQQAFQRQRGSMLVSMALARAGLADSARHVAEHARVDADQDPVRELTYFEAITRTIVGDTTEAIRQLAAYAAANPQLRTSLAQDAWFKPLRNDPRFTALLSSGS